MEFKKKFDALVEQYKDNLDYLTEGVLIDVTEQFYTQMKNKGLNRTELAQKLNCSNAYVTKLLNGSENLTLRKLVQIAHVLDCTFDFALIPRQYEVKRHISFNAKKFDTTGYTQELKIEDTNDQPYSPIAA
jgi:transcriptional regulator with XRE-family HTH domain